MALPTDVDGTWVNVSSYLDAGEVRRADAAMFAGDGSPIGVLGGVVRHSDTSMAVTVDGSDVVTIQPGAVVIPGNAVAGTGPYRFGLPTAITGGLAARNATNPRIDLIVARQMDTDVVGAHAAKTGRIQVIPGTPASSPAVPTLPTMAVELGRITVPNTGGGAATVDSSWRTYAVGPGGVLPVPVAARLPGSLPIWSRAIALDTGARYVYNGTSWVNDGVFAEAAGSVTVTVTSANFATAAIAFPAGRFTVTPKLSVTNVGGSGATVMHLVGTVSGTSGGSVTAIARDTGNVTTTVNVDWHAIQMTPTSAAG